MAALDEVVDQLNALVIRLRRIQKRQRRKAPDLWSQPTLTKRRRPNPGVVNIRPRKLISILALAYLSGCAAGPYERALNPWNPTDNVLMVCRKATDPAIKQRCTDEALGSTDYENQVRFFKLLNVSKAKCDLVYSLRSQAMKYRFSPLYGYPELEVTKLFLNSLPREAYTPNMVVLDDGEIRAAVAFAYRWAGIEQLNAENLRMSRACAGLPPLGPRVPSQPFDAAKWRNTMNELYGPGSAP